jgi:putative alpha-1,2-mannosidase
MTIHATGAATDTPYISSLSVNGMPVVQPWLPASIALNGGTLDYTMSKTPNKDWGTDPKSAPPSFGP